jgi:hypothetical protein
LATIYGAAVNMEVQFSLLHTDLHSFGYAQEWYSWVIRYLYLFDQPQHWFP